LNRTNINVQELAVRGIEREGQNQNFPVDSAGPVNGSGTNYRVKREKWWMRCSGKQRICKRVEIESKFLLATSITDTVNTKVL